MTFEFARGHIWTWTPTVDSKVDSESFFENDPQEEIQSRCTFFQNGVDSWVTWIVFSLELRTKEYSYIVLFCFIISTTDPKVLVRITWNNPFFFLPLNSHKSYLRPKFPIATWDNWIYKKEERKKGGGTCSAKHISQRPHAWRGQKLFLQIHSYFNGESLLAGAFVGLILVKSRIQSMSRREESRE